jgi:hypothetical protein
MSFYPVRGLHVLGYQRTPTRAGTFDEVDEPFMSSLSISAQFGINMQGFDGKSNANFLERERLRKAHLEEQYDYLGKAAFIKKWVEFSFSGDEAIGATAMVIDDYFRINGNGFVSRTPGTDSRSKEHYEKTDFNMWDENLYINLVYESRKKQKWWNSKPQPNVMAFHLNVLKIKEISGTLDHFTIQTKTHRLRFSWHIIIEENPIKKIKA